MSAFPDYDHHDAVGLAALVRSGEVSARMLAEAAIARIEAANPALNAIIAKCFDAALRRADAVAPGSPLPFTGVPFLLKDLSHPHPDLPLTYGSRFLARHHPTTPTRLVVAFEAAGLNVLGRSSSPEFGLTATTEPVLHGPCRNPWYLDRTPGGSSGGAAAAVAAGLVPMAHASDGGGSIRIPASCCGLFGFKPSRPHDALESDKPGGLSPWLSVDHVLTRTVRDGAMVRDVLETNPAGAEAVAAGAGPFTRRLGRPPAPMTIAVLSGPLFNVALDPECRAATEQLAVQLEGLGHRIETVDATLAGAISPAELREAFLAVWFAECAQTLAYLQAEAGRRARGDEFETVTWAMALLGDFLRAREVTAAVATMRRTAVRLEAFHDRYDILLMPTLAAPPLRIGAQRGTATDARMIDLLRHIRAPWLYRWLHQRFRDEAFAWVGYTPLANMTGQPAMSLPVAMSADGLPIGVQVMGRRGSDASLLQLAAQIEAQWPWNTRRPRQPAMPRADGVH